MENLQKYFWMPASSFQHEKDLRLYLFTLKRDFGAEKQRNDLRRNNS